MMDYFNKLSLIKKIIVSIIISALVLTALFDISGLLGLIITMTMLYLIIKPIYNLFNPQPVEYTAQSNDEYRDRQQEEDDDCDYIKEEEERLSQENNANQEALDNLL